MSTCEIQITLSVHWTGKWLQGIIIPELCDWEFPFVLERGDWMGGGEEEFQRFSFSVSPRGWLHMGRFWVAIFLPIMVVSACVPRCPFRS